MSVARVLAPKFKVGDWASFIYGVSRAWVQVIEDRGPLGVNRERIYRLRMGEGLGEDAIVEFELSQGHLAPVEVNPKEIVSYLKRGGLLSILRSNLGGGRDRPQAWLTFNPQGELTHTLDQERGFLGGAVIPFFALLGYHVYAPKVEEVVEFLASFGLDRDQAMDVITSVGTAP